MDKYGLGQYAPGMAAYFAGQNHSQNRQAEFGKQRELEEIIRQRQIANQQSQQMNPLLLQQRGLENQGLSAGLPGITADSALKGTNATKAAGTLTTDIDAANSKNENQIGKDKSEMANRFMKDLQNFGTQMDQVPVPMRSKVLGELMGGAGYKMDSPMVQQLFKELTSDPDNMSKKMFSISEKIGKAAAAASPQYHQRMDELGIQGPQKLKEIEAQGKEQRRLEGMKIKARTEQAQAKANQASNSIWDQVRSGKLKLNEMPAAFTAAARNATTEEERDAMLMEAQKAADLIRLKSETPKPGTIDPAAATGMPEVKRPPNPYAKGGGPKPGTKENPIKLD